MTAEIVVRNREAVILAADSAVSSEVGSLIKTSTSANKIFNLSHNHPVGIMIYGNASFMGLPWETLIKYYRGKILPSDGFNTIEEYASSFIEFLNSRYIKFLSSAEEEYIISFAFSLFNSIYADILRRIEMSISEGKEITDDRVHELCNMVLNEFFDRFQRLNKVLNINDSRLVLRKYEKKLEQVRNKVFNKLDLPTRLHKQIARIMIYGLARHFMANVSSGIVIAGFGHDEFIPEVKAYSIEGILWVDRNGKKEELLKYSFLPHQSTNNDSSHVIAYAQADMVQRFMNGVDNNYRYTEQRFIAGLCDDFINKTVNELRKYNDEEKEVIKKELTEYGNQIVHEFEQNMNKFIARYFSLPIVRAVGRLPKNELAIMAEALVHLTSLKRKISEEPETVAEPIDVAVITKGDGFVWVKRKHYFQADLNINYFMKRFKEFSNEKNTN